MRAASQARTAKFPILMDADIIAVKRDLAAKALFGVARQASASSGFLASGDLRAALRAYDRLVAILREFLAADIESIRAFEKATALTRAAAIEWRTRRHEIKR